MKPSYSQIIESIFARLPVYQKVGTSALNFKLNAIRDFCNHLDSPETKFKSIHVAGTNGKGSSSHMLASILQTAGYKTGLYSSPHLIDFRERIKINGKPISKKNVVDFVTTNNHYIEHHKLSFFELTVAMAFDYFSKKQVDIAIIEVGLGGRLDSTNIIYPEVCLITNISLDHTDVLGSTLEEIAFEKAGIIKTDRPVVISEVQSKTMPIFIRVAKERKAPLLVAQKLKKNYPCGLKGDFQEKNIKGVITVISELKGFEISEKDIELGLSKVLVNTGLQGRWQQISSSPKTVLDITHNEAGFVEIISQINAETFNQIHFIIGFVKGKSVKKILKILPKKAYYYFCQPSLPRALESSILRDFALEENLKGDSYPSVEQAYLSALKSAKEEDFIYIGGSNFIVSDFFKKLKV